MLDRLRVSLFFFTIELCQAEGQPGGALVEAGLAEGSNPPRQR